MRQTAGRAAYIFILQAGEQRSDPLLTLTVHYVPAARLSDGSRQVSV